MLNSLRSFVEEKRVRYRFEEYRGYRGMGWKHPEHRYHFENGIIIKGMYQKMNRTAGGWIAIEYPCDVWEEALELQN